MNNCTFTNNQANNGGAISTAGDGYLSVSNSNFTNNKAMDYGGALSGYNYVVNNCIFTNNQATLGGAIYYSTAEFSSFVNGSTFTNNQASHGGAIYTNGRYSLGVNGSTFTNNKAYNNGGAINGLIGISGSTFTNNQASHGGAIYTNNTWFSLYVNNCTFTNNQATKYGGAIYNICTLDLNLVNFKNNIAGNKYNAIYADFSSKIYKNKVTITPTEDSPVHSDLKIAKVTKKGSYHYVAIKNIGKKSTGKKFYLGVYVGKKRINIKLVKILGVGKSTTVKVLIAKKYRNSLKTFKADCTNRIKEMNESNNSLKAR